MTAPNATNTTSRTRIANLESEVSRLWTAVRTLQRDPNRVSAESVLPLSQAGSSRRSSCDDFSAASSTSPPRHLLQLFDNGPLDNSSRSQAQSSSRITTARDSNTLRDLLPSRHDVLAISAYATPWLRLYTSLFPISNVPKSGQEMLSQFDQAALPTSQPMAISSTLLSIAMSIQQVPELSSRHRFESINDVARYVNEVIVTVERLVVLDDNRAGSVDGVQVTLMFLRM